jgi:hypothetical protein
VTVDVRIRRCTMTIRRRDGWSWGPAPQPHVDAALTGVEAALEAALAEAGVPAGVDAHLDEPVYLEVGSDGVATVATWNALVERLRSLPAAAADVAGGSRPQDEGGAGALGNGNGIPEAGVAGEHAAGALARTLARWSRGGRMALIVSAWPAALVQTWIAAVSDAVRRPVVAPSDAPGALTAEAVELIADGVLGAAAPQPSAREAADRLLVLLGALIAALGDRLPDAAAQALARQRVAGSGGANQAPAEQRVTGAHDATAPAEQRLIGAGDAAQQQTTRGDEPVDGAPGTTLEPITVGGEPAADADTTARLQITRDHEPVDTTIQAEVTPDDEPGTSADTATQAANDEPTAGPGPSTPQPITSPQQLIPDDEPAAVAARAAAATTLPPARASGAAATGRPVPPLERVIPALPLLVLAQLSRIGYVDAIVGATAAASLPLGAGALGAAVAGKVLPAPGRGWSREPAEAAAVVLASGGSAEHLPEALAAIAAHEQDLVASLAAALQSAYADGRSAKDELLVWAGDEGIVCGEEEGLLPAVWATSEPELDAALASLGRPPVRRGDGFAQLARVLDERPGLPRTDAPALERQLGAAAGTALGLIALGLWGSAGQAATPLLALERLADLEARVRSGPDGLLVSIPRGQRWLDLSRGGLLDLFTIPWLPAGRLEIGTW